MSAKSGRRSGGMDGSVEEKEWTTVDTEMDNKDSKEMTLEDKDQSLNDFNAEYESIVGRIESSEPKDRIVEQILKSLKKMKDLFDNEVKTRMTPRVG